jgi:uncharacterized protein (DUF1778 family)
MTRGGKRPGAGRPSGSALPPEQSKNERITVRFTADQLSRIKQAAEAEGLPYTTFIRLSALRAANNLLDNLLDNLKK